MMNPIEKANTEASEIDKKIKGVEKCIRDLTEGRPALALEAQRGDSEPLRKLDAQIDAAKQEIENLQDAALDEFARLAALSGPKKKMPARPEDRPSGVLGLRW